MCKETKKKCQNRKNNKKYALAFEKIWNKISNKQFT